MEQRYGLKNLTPPEMCAAAACPALYELEEVASENCGVGACPAVYEGESGKEVYIIIGTQLSPEDFGLVGKVGEGETVIEVPKGLLSNL